ncbi:MAG TPA: DNA-binding transcriptional regulator [Phycisphaerae bacterium]|nr:DNA-binding transcriptional regulator [Phycisphaerae bacterium]HQL75838.1 DNA-binding transcriptional regulator [Phycisphaerae bacterium]
MAKRRRVALMLELDWPFKRHHDVFAGTQQYAQEKGGWECIVDAQAQETLAGPRRAKAAYDGIIARVTPQLAEAARRAGVPVVNVWTSSPVLDVPLVLPDFAAAGRMAAEHLIGRGFRHFGFLGFTRQRSNKTSRQAFEAAVAGAGFSCSSLTVPPSYAERPGHWGTFNDRLDQWIAAWQRPIGVYVTYDLLCRYLACACLRAGVRIPTEAALVGTHNEPLICAHPEPSLTSIELGYQRVGYRAAELLDQMMDGTPTPVEEILIEPAALLPRQSTDVLAVDDPLVALALRFASEHGHERIKVGDVAAAVHVTRRTLERRFRAVLGRSIRDEIVRLRIERAKRLLAQGRTPIKRLASEAGFRDDMQMCTEFKRLEGITPSEYRRQRRLG